MRPKSRPQISCVHKASVSLFAQPTALTKLNTNYLELHGDDEYFTLENGAKGVDQRRLLQGHSKASIGIGSRFSEQEVDAVSQRLKLEELPETWTMSMARAPPVKVEGWVFFHEA
ncbi:uncharacterized protein LOC121768185 isoform X4 [Salvia splendens]|uniref:uncharacterized protein LOC121768185 isoform X4 n=1 Tax=Salvia splendens TaxID=180675 RepID=UPI001C26602F|nr:uncharacterized protein LOC121768185 isoform X4 [Salvia splendens]